MKKQVILWATLIVIALGACNKAVDTKTNTETPVYKEVLERRSNVVDDGYSIIPLTNNGNGTLTGSLADVPLIFSNITYPLYDEAGMPMPDRTGDPFIAEVAIDPSNTVGASIMENDGESFTIFFSGYLSGGCNATPTTLTFDTQSYTDKQTIEWDNYQEKLTKYLDSMNAYQSNPGSNPKPVKLPMKKTVALRSYFQGPICAEDHVFTVFLIKTEGGGFAMKVR